MTKKEMTMILAVLKEAYKDFQVTENKVSFWNELLGDLDFQAVKVAVYKLILTNTFPPSISEIRKAVVEVIQPKLLNGTEALEEVTEAIRKFGTYDIESAFNGMSPLTKRTVKAMGWNNICSSESPEVWRGEFLKFYGQLQKRAEEDNLLPEGLKEQIKELSGKTQGIIKELAERKEMK